MQALWTLLAGGGRAFHWLLAASSEGLWAKEQEGLAVGEVEGGRWGSAVSLWPSVLLPPLPVCVGQTGLV